MPTSPPIPPPPASQLQENGLLVTSLRAAAAAPRRLRDRLLARQLHAPGLRLGRSPRLLGLRHLRLGRNLSAGDHLWLHAVTLYAGQPLHPLLTLGDDANLSDNVHIACAFHISIGAGLLCGSHVLISDHSHGLYSARAALAAGIPQSPPNLRPALRPLSPGAVHIGHNVWLGDRVSVLAGASIGDGAILGAGSVVTSTIPPATIAVGAPARPIRQWSPGTGAWEPL